MNPLTSNEKGRRYQQPPVAVATQYVMLLLLGFPHTHIKYANLVPEGRTHPHSHFSSLFVPSPKPNPHAGRFKSIILQTNPDDNGRDGEKTQAHNGLLDVTGKQEECGSGFCFIPAIPGTLVICPSSKLYSPGRDVEHRRIELLAPERGAFSIPALLQHLVDFLKLQQRHINLCSIHAYMQCTKSLLAHQIWGTQIYIPSLPWKLAGRPSACHWFQPSLTH